MGLPFTVMLEVWRSLTLVKVAIACYNTSPVSKILLQWKYSSIIRTVYLKHQKVKVLNGPCPHVMYIMMLLDHYC